jgi:S1-C subfamily serine protease
MHRALGVIGLVLARDEVEAELGIKIQEVRPASTSELAGIRAGEYIHRLDGELMASIERFDGAIKRHLPGETLEVVLRDEYGNERIVLLEVGACGKTIEEVCPSIHAPLRSGSRAERLALLTTLPR